MRRILFIMICITFLFASVGFPTAGADTLHTQIPGETVGEFTSPFNLAPEFLFVFNYLIKTEAHVSILDADGQELQTIDLSAEGVSIGEHKTFELKKGEYTVKEDFAVTGTPDSVFLQGQLLESKMSFDWKFTASDDGMYDFSITADAWDLKLNLTGDLTLQNLGETSASIPVELVTTRFIQKGEKMKYTATYTFSLSKTSSFELISKAEETLVTFVVTGIVRNKDGTVVPNASVTVANEVRKLSKITTTDEAGIYKVTFVGPQDSTLAQTGDVLKVTVGDVELSYTLKEDDISQTRAVVNVLIEKLKITSVAISPKTKFGIGEEITVTATGSRGAKSAFFSIEGIVENILMHEKPPRTYVGKYIVKAGDNAENAVVTVTLTDALKNTTSQTLKVELKNLTPWDINQDGKVDILELVLVSKNYGKQDISYGDDAWAADINGDNMIDILDLVLVGKHFGEEYPLVPHSPHRTVSRRRR